MRNVFLCKSCKEYSPLEKRFITRTEMVEFKGGDEFYVQCDHCMNNQKIHANQVIAEESTTKKLLFVGGSLLLAFVFTLFLWNIGWVSTLTLALPVAVYSLLSKGEQESVAIFNKNRI